MTPVFHLDALNFSYTSKPVLRDVSINIGPGEFVAFVGPNGAGRRREIHPVMFVLALIAIGLLVLEHSELL